jgi:hypothetical protein
MHNYQNIETEIIDGTGLNIDKIGGGAEYGWSENWGQELITEHIIPRLNGDDTVIYLCSGHGRASMPFSMRETKVVAVDSSGDNITRGDEIRRMAGAKPVERVIKDIKDLNSDDLDGGGTIILAADALIHFPKKEADEIINNIRNLLNPNKRGLVYINVPSTESFLFQDPTCFGATRFDERTLIINCDCTGEFKDEFLPFYNRGELQAMLALQGANIIATNDLRRYQSSILHEVIAEFKPLDNKK